GRRASPSAVMVTDHSAAEVTLPPISAQRDLRANDDIPREILCAICTTRLLAGMPSAQRNHRGRAPAAARSDRLTAKAFHPTSSGEKRRRSKWTDRKSVV